MNDGIWALCRDAGARGNLGWVLRVLEYLGHLFSSEGASLLALALLPHLHWSVKWGPLTKQPSEVKGQQQSQGSQLYQLSSLPGPGGHSRWKRLPEAGGSQKRVSCEFKVNLDVFWSKWQYRQLCQILCAKYFRHYLNLTTIVQSSIIIPFYK